MQKHTLTRGRWALALAAIASLAGCCPRQQSCCPAKSDSVKSLGELPREQLRTFLKGHVGDWRGETDQSQGKPPPPVQRPIPEDATFIDLPSPGTITVGRIPLVQAIKQRRSLREYAPTPISQEELSFLLWSTQGVSSYEQAADGNIVGQFRTVPSGGSRHPFETYLLINRVEGLVPGLYRFMPFGHKLCLLQASTALPDALQTACYGQAFPGKAAVVFVWSAVPERTEWRYGYIAHRMIAMDAGHVCQNLYLSAESIGAGTCAMLGYSQPHMDALIGVDGRDEFTIYMAAVGKKVAGD
jgi:SagB-type dehydrogenase family enzyme